MKIIYGLFVLLTMSWAASAALAQTNFEKGLMSAAKSYGLDELVKEATLTQIFRQSLSICLLAFHLLLIQQQ